MTELIDQLIFSIHSHILQDCLEGGRGGREGRGGRGIVGGRGGRGMKVMIERKDRFETQNNR